MHLTRRTDLICSHDILRYMLEAARNGELLRALSGREISSDLSCVWIFPRRLSRRLRFQCCRRRLSRGNYLLWKTALMEGDTLLAASVLIVGMVLAHVAAQGTVTPDMIGGARAFFVDEGCVRPRRIR